MDAAPSVLARPHVIIESGRVLVLLVPQRSGLEDFNEELWVEKPWRFLAVFEVF